MSHRLSCCLLANLRGNIKRSSGTVGDKMKVREILLVSSKKSETGRVHG